MYRVEFLEPVAVKGWPPLCDYYFGSLAAIYELFTHEQIGCKVAQLWRKVQPGVPYSNSRCTVSQEAMVRKKTNRGVK